MGLEGRGDPTRTARCRFLFLRQSNTCVSLPKHISLFGQASCPQVRSTLRPSASASVANQRNLHSLHKCKNGKAVFALDRAQQGTLRVGPPSRYGVRVCSVAAARALCFSATTVGGASFIGGGPSFFLAMAS